MCLMKMNEAVIKMMKRAVERSTLCQSFTYPNPKVGAVIFDDEGNIISEGHTGCYGGDHAEIDALRKMDFSAKGLNMAVTLEPCNHFGKTPPCSHAILKAGIKKVYIAKKEENGKACNGACYLMENGVDVEFIDEFAPVVEKINKFFFKNVRTGLPWVTVKVAVSCDGFVTEKEGFPTQITNEASEIYVHRLRAEHMAIAVGAGTVNSDDPQLTVRKVSGKNPVPVVFSRNLSINKNADILKRKPIIITSNNDELEISALNKAGALVELFAADFSVRDVLKLIYDKYRLNSILVEGGPKLIRSLLFENVIDEFQINKASENLGEGVELFDRSSQEFFENRYKFEHEIYFGTDHLKIFKRK
jgi:diaminohydroxyphosphoribosylaminopyrimidine deaminase / 5-amino-6-(5-phosphoribosylamino)uracil reductase